MDNAFQHTPQEDTVAEANCSGCGDAIYVETMTVGSEVDIPHRRVTGSYMQFIDSEGNPFGPCWAYCSSCGTNPIERPEVKAAYLKLRKKQCH